MKNIFFALLISLFSFQAYSQIPETQQPYFSVEGDWVVTTHASFNGSAIDTIGSVFAIVIYFPESMEFTILIGNDYENGEVETLWFPITREEYGNGASIKYISNDSAELIIDDEQGVVNVSVAYVSTQKHPIIYKYNGVFYMEDDED